MIGLVLTVMTVMGVTNHMGWEMFPRRLVHSRAALADNGQPHQRHHDLYNAITGSISDSGTSCAAPIAAGVTRPAALALALSATLLTVAGERPGDLSLTITDCASPRAGDDLPDARGRSLPRLQRQRQRAHRDRAASHAQASFTHLSGPLCHLGAAR